MFVLSAHSGNNNEVHGGSNRNRNLTLLDKKHIVDQYFNFVENRRQELKLASAKTIDLAANGHKNYLADTEEFEEDTNLTQKTSVRAFVEFYNKNQQKQHYSNDNETKNRITLANFGVFRWLRAYLRGDYFEWGGVNDLNKSNCRSKLILQIINRNLKANHGNYSCWNAIVRSPSAEENYGAIAKRDIPAGTVLCFVEGVLFNKPIEHAGAKHIRLNVVPITDNSYIDISDFYCCYARYYNRSSKNTLANTSMFCAQHWTDPNKAICCVSNVDICRGVEIIVEKTIRKL
jgi:hypothetical protein